MVRVIPPQKKQGRSLRFGWDDGERVLVCHEMVTYVGDFLDASLRWNDGRDWVDLGSGVGMTGRGCAERSGGRSVRGLELG